MFLGIPQILMSVSLTMENVITSVEIFQAHMSAHVTLLTY